MYATDVPKIKAYAEASPDNLANVITFVLLSIRVPFSRVQAGMADVRRHGADSASLWGWKRAGFEYVRDNRGSMYRELAGARSVVTVIDQLATRVPGLGIVKGAFVAQMLGHEVACMDSRNLLDLGYDRRTFREIKPGTKLVTRLRRVESYVRLTVETGGAEHWWDHWCSGIAPSMGKSPNEVSELHWRIPSKDGKEDTRGAGTLRRERNHDWSTDSHDSIPF